jgi:hypothetical protein
MSTSRLSHVVMYAIMLVVFLGLISMTFDLHRFAFMGELLIFLFLLGMALILVMGMSNDFSWVWKLFKWFYVIVFVNLILVYLLSAKTPDLFFPVIVAAIVGFFIAVFNTSRPKQGKKIKRTFKPGKYIASKTGAKFHAPKCDWAKRIKKANGVWFHSKAEATKAGFKADDCVK